MIESDDKIYKQQCCSAPFEFKRHVCAFQCSDECLSLHTLSLSVSSTTHSITIQQLPLRCIAIDIDRNGWPREHWTHMSFPSFSLSADDTGRVTFHTLPYCALIDVIHVFFDSFISFRFDSCVCESVRASRHIPRTPTSKQQSQFALQIFRKKKFTGISPYLLSFVGSVSSISELSFFISHVRWVLQTIDVQVTRFKKRDRKSPNSGCGW